MPETENTPNLEMRTCVTCGKIFYENLDDEKMRAANGIDPRRECYDCSRARALLKEQRSDIKSTFAKYRKYIKTGLLVVDIAYTIFLIGVIATPGELDFFIIVPFAIMVSLFWILFIKL